MWLSVISQVMLIVGLILAQIFFWSLPLGLSFLNLVLVCLIYVLFIFGPRRAAVWFVACGWLLDVLKLDSFGLNLLALILCFAVVYWLLEKFVTNRSLYSIWLLTAVATIIYDLLIFGGVWQEGASIIDLAWWQGQLFRFLANIAAATVLFYVFNLLSQRIRPVFLRDFKRY